jgi:hypothetical protein
MEKDPMLIKMQPMIGKNLTDNNPIIYGINGNSTTLALTGVSLSLV